MDKAINDLRNAVNGVSFELSKDLEVMEYKSIKSAYISLCSALCKLEGIKKNDKNTKTPRQHRQEKRPQEWAHKIQDDPDDSTSA